LTSRHPISPFILAKSFFATTTFVATLAVLLLASCKATKDVASEKEPLKNKSAGFLLKRYERNAFDFDWLGMKVDADMASLGETQSFKATIRMKRDSVIWISISPALGIEVFRLLITPDSLKYISKIPDNKYYYTGGFEALDAITKTGLDFGMLQDLLVGNAIGLEKDEGKFRSEIDDENYLLISKYKRKVKRAVGINDKDIEPEDSIAINPNDKRYLKAVEKVDEQDLIISRYWLEGGNFRLVKSLFNDLLHQRTIELHYSEFRQHGEQFYPEKGVMRISERSQTQELRFEIGRMATDKIYEFDFEIPEGYPRKVNP